MSTGEVPVVKSKLPIRLTLRHATGEMPLRISMAFWSLAASLYRATVQTKWPSCGHGKAGCCSLVMPRPTHWGFACRSRMRTLSLGKRMLAKLAALPFSVALFGHGRTITSGAAEKFARKWGTA